MTTSHITDRDWTRFSATVLFLIQDVKASEHSPKLNDVYRLTLLTLLRRFTDKFWYKRLLVSKACFESSRAEGIDDIRKYDPDELPANVRPNYHLEHFLPIAELRTRLMKIENPTQQKVEECLKTAQIAKIWILKKEDDCLTKSGKRHKRENPAEAYKAVGIEILYE